MPDGENAGGIQSAMIFMALVQAISKKKKRKRKRKRKKKAGRGMTIIIIMVLLGTTGSGGGTTRMASDRGIIPKSAVAMCCVLFVRN